MAERKTREAKSDTGILSLVKEMMSKGFGLSPETVTKCLKIVRAQGELAQMKLHVRGLSGGTYKRFNQALDMAEKDLAKKQASGEEEKEEAPEKKENVKESTFLKYLMTELADAGDVDYTGTDDSKLDARQKAAKRQQMKDAPTKRRLDKEMGGADTMQKKIAAENKRHQMAIKKIRAEETGE